MDRFTGEYIFDARSNFLHTLTVGTLAGYIAQILSSAVSCAISHMGTTAFALAAGWFLNTVEYRRRAMKAQEGRSSHRAWWAKWWSERKTGIWLASSIWFALFLYCIADAAHNSWNTEHISAISNKAQAEELQNQLNALTLPQLQSGKLFVALGWGKNREEGTSVTIRAYIKNKGAPTVLDNWRLWVEFTDRRVFEGKIAQQPLPNDTLTVHFSDKKHTVILQGIYWLPQITRTDAVTQTHAANGWMTALIRNLDAQEIIDKQATVVVQCKDVNGKTFEIREKMDSESVPPVSIGEFPGATKQKNP